MYRVRRRSVTRYLSDQLANRLMAFVVFVFIVIPIVFLIINAASAEDDIINRLQRDIGYLCSPALAGRDVPGQYGDSTAIWLKEQFVKIGLQPGVDGNEYFQKVPLISARLDTANTELNLITANLIIKLQWGENMYFFPRNISSFEKNCELAYAAYGINLPEENRNDFKSGFIGKAAVVLAGSGDLPSHKAGRSAMTAFKAVAARNAGAALLIVLHKADDSGEWLPPNERTKIAESRKPLTDLPESDPDFPVFHVNYSVFADLFIDSEQENVPEFKNASVIFKSSFKDQKVVNGYNVCGKLPGKTAEYIILGAHYDHLGIESAGDGENPVFYPGANDNATGIAGLLEIGRSWKQKNRSEKGLLFVAFAAEEDGMLGSRYFVNNLPVPIESILTMVNLDMIGGVGFASMREAGQQDAEPDPDYAAAYYSAAAPRAEEIIQASAKYGTLKLDVIPVGKFPYNDGGPFHEKQIPTIHMFSGFHSQYSQISDTPDKLDWDKLMRLVLLTDRLLVNLNKEQGKISFDPQIRPGRNGMKY